MNCEASITGCAMSELGGRGHELVAVCVGACDAMAMAVVSVTTATEQVEDFDGVVMNAGGARGTY